MFDVARSCLYEHRERTRHIDVERMALRSRVHELFVESRSSAGRNLRVRLVQRFEQDEYPPNGFEDIDLGWQWVLKFVTWYNGELFA